MENKVEVKDNSEDLLLLRLQDSSDMAGIAEEKNDKIKTPNQAKKIKSRKNLLVQGTFIRCVLTSRIVSSHPGGTSCVVTENVYSIDGSTLLIPKGSKFIGETGGIANDRIMVTWNRMITPDYFNITLSSYGTDNMGGVGHPGHVKTHFLKKFASAVMISLLADAVDKLGEKYKKETVVQTDIGITTKPTETHTAKTIQSAAEQQLEKYQNLGSIITINQGTLINIYVTEDIDFSKVIHNE